MFALTKKMLAIVVSLAAISVLLAFTGGQTTADVPTSSPQFCNNGAYHMTAGTEQISCGCHIPIPPPPPPDNNAPSPEWSDAAKFQGSLLTVAMPVAAYVAAFALAQAAKLSGYSMQYQPLPAAHVHCAMRQ